MLAGSALLLWKLGSAWLAGAPEAFEPPPITYRLDAVGELAQEAEIGPATAPEPEPEPEPVTAVTP